MTSPRVLKFGGAALRDGESVRRAVKIVQEQGGSRPLVVVSAHQGVTDLLARSADETGGEGRVWDEVRVRHRTLLRQLEIPGDHLDRLLRELRTILEELARTRRTDRASRDFVLSFGERMSARVMAAALRREGVPAAPLDAFDLGLVTEPGESYSPVTRPSEEVRRVLSTLPGVPVVTGFLARDHSGNVTTLGPDGSDLSAAWLGEAVDAEEIQLWKTVAGVYTADPRLVPAARLLPELGWWEATEMTAQGASILHQGTAAVAQRAGIPLWIRDVRDPGAAGTRIFEGSGREGVLAVVHRSPVARLHIGLDTCVSPETELARLFGALNKRGLRVHAATSTAKDASVLVAEEPMLAEKLQDLSEIEVEGGLCTISVVGRGVGESEEVAEKFTRALDRAGVSARPSPGGRSLHTQALLARAETLSPALRAAHAALIEA
jgi:aspartate kinase